MSVIVGKNPWLNVVVRVVPKPVAAIGDPTGVLPKPLLILFYIKSFCVFIIGVIFRLDNGVLQFENLGVLISLIV